MVPRLVFCVWLGTALRSDFEDSAALRAELEDADLEMNSAQPSSASGLGTAVMMLMQQADSFYASGEMAAERQEAERFNVAAGVQMLGLDVQDRFRMFAVRRALQLSALHAEAEQDPWAEAEPMSAMELDDPDLKAATWGSGEWTKNAQRWQLMSSQVRGGRSYKQTCDHPERMDHLLREMQSDFGSKSMQGSHGQAMAHKALKNYCVIQEMVKKKASKIEVNQEEVQRLMQATTATPRSNADKSKLPPTPRNGIGASAEDKRAYQKAEAIRNLKWISNWDATDVQQLKELHVRATIMNKRLNTLVEFVTENGEIDWMTVEPKEPSKGIKSKFVSGVKFASKYTVDFIKQLGTNTILFFTNCWQSFKLRLANSERKCKEDGEKGALKAAKKGGLHTSTEEDSIEKTVNQLSSMDADDLNMESAKVELAMGNAVSDAAQGALSEAAAREKMSAAKVTAKSLHKDLNAGKLDSIDDAEEEIESVEESVCKTQRKTALQTLQDVFRQTRSAFSSGLKLAAPNLGIRGVGVSAAGLGAGLEEVIDFRSREIAQFKWGTGFFGPSVTGVSLGGYAGVGWKGYKQNWTLQEAYVTGLYTGVGLSPSIFGLNAGLSITFATDADNSIPGPWIPEPHGVNGITLGWSAGASITKAVIPMSADVGASYYWYLNSECFGSLSEMIKYIWVPRCKDCQGATENAKIMALRLSINLPSFPFISETAFSLLAAMYDKFVREPGHRPTECSPGSVTLRHDASHLIRDVGELMFENARLLEDLVKKMDVSTTQMAIAEKYNPSFQQSQEYANWRKAATEDFDTCSTIGPIMQVQAEDEEEVMKELSDEDLLGLCETYSKNYALNINCHAPGETRATLEERLTNYDELSKGSFSVQEMDNLIHDVRATSPAGRALHAQKEICQQASKSGHDDCLSSLNVLRIMINNIDQDSMLTLCESKGLICKRKSTALVCIRKCSTPYDLEALALKILVAAGGGAADKASSTDPFGTCTSNLDCWLENTECLGDDEERYCQCKENHCFRLVQNASNPTDKSDLIPACEARSKEWREIQSQVKRNALTYRYTLGQMVGRLKSLPTW